MSSPHAHPPARRRPRLRGDDGAVVVEAALVLPLLFLIVFGMIDFGITLSDQINLREGVREGARQAVVVAPGGTQARPAADVVTFTKERIDARGGQTRVWVNPQANGSISAGQPGSWLTVCAYVPMDSLSGFFGPLLDGRWMYSEVTMRVEQPLPYSSASGDAAPSGEDWSSCHV